MVRIIIQICKFYYANSIVKYIIWTPLCRFYHADSIIQTLLCKLYYADFIMRTLLWLLYYNHYILFIALWPIYHCIMTIISWPLYCNQYIMTINCIVTFLLCAFYYIDLICWFYCTNFCKLILLYKFCYSNFVFKIVQWQLYSKSCFYMEIVL